MLHHRRTIPPMYARSGRGRLPRVGSCAPVTALLLLMGVCAIITIVRIGWPALVAGVIGFGLWVWEEF